MYTDWCCFYYIIRNSLAALLEALCALCTYTVYTYTYNQVGGLLCEPSLQMSRSCSYACNFSGLRLVRILFLWKWTIVSECSECRSHFRFWSGTNLKWGLHFPATTVSRTASFLSSYVFSAKRAPFLQGSFANKT